MPDFPGNTLFRAVVKGHTSSGNNLVNVFHWFLYSSGGADLNETTAIESIRTHLTSLWQETRDSTPGAMGWDTADVDYKLPGAADFVTWRNLVLNLTGNDAGEPLPSGVAATVTGPTSKKGRVARKFLPPFSERCSNLQQWTTSAVVALTSWAVRWLTGIDLAAYSKWIYPIAYSVVDKTFTALTAARANVIPGYQRRRKPGVGF